MSFQHGFIPVLRANEAEFSIRKIVRVWDVELVDITCIVAPLPYNSALVDICDPLISKYLDVLVHFGNWSFKIIDIMVDARTASIFNAYFVLIGAKISTLS